MIAPRQVISNPNTAQMICDVLEGGLIVEDNEESSQRQFAVSIAGSDNGVEPKLSPSSGKFPDPIDEDTVPRTPRKTSLFDLAVNKSGLKPRQTSTDLPISDSVQKSTSILKLLGLDHLVDQQVSTVVDEFEISGVDTSLIRETAENVLEHVMHHCNNFPAPHGPELMSSTINDPAFVDDTAKAFDKYLYFTYNDSTIIALIEIPGSTPQTTKSRIIARNMSGKYVWDSSLFFEGVKRCQDLTNNEQFEADTEIKTETSLGVAKKFEFRSDIEILTPTNISNMDPPSKYTRKHGEMPIWTPECEGVDMLDQLLQ
jgi:hypothetical protein